MKTSKEELLNLLSQESITVLSQAYLYAKNMELYGIDVTEKWATAIVNQANLERAYNKGWMDCQERMMERRNEDGN